MAWANREAAEDCIRRAVAKLAAFDTEGARRFLQKSLGLFELDEAREVECKIAERMQHEAAVQRVLEASDYFELLGVARDVNTADLLRSYKRLSKDVHPDKNGARGAEDAFKRLNDAKSILSDEREREIYALKHPPRRAAASKPPPPRQHPPHWPPPNPFSQRPPQPARAQASTAQEEEEESREPRRQQQPWEKQAEAQRQQRQQQQQQQQ